MTPQLTVDFIKRLGQTTLEMRFTAEAEILVLFGPSGAGKTQTLQAVAGLSTPDSGQIRFDDAIFFQRMPGKPVVNLPARKRRIGYVFQQYALFPHMSALENVAFPLGRRRDARDRAMELLERMHLAHLAQRMPHELSGGQQQRIAIARALATEPHILLLDESFSALDRPVRERLHEEIRMVQAERRLVVLYVTHNLDDAFAVGHLGAEITAYIRPEDIRLVYPDRSLSRMVIHNHLEGIVVERRLERHMYRLRVALPDGRPIEVIYPSSLYATMNLTPGERVRLALRKESIVVIAPRERVSPPVGMILSEHVHDVGAIDPASSSLT
jgi:ABC-type nitrate/sulfonate/bicarbonate transport system ATPase subunit